MSPLSLLVVAALTPLGGVGFTLLVQTSPLGRIAHKPFSCRVCLSGWGSIATAGALLLAHPLATWFALALVGTGAARVAFALAEALQATADRAQNLDLPDSASGAPEIDVSGG